MGAARCARVPPRAPGRGARGGRPWSWTVVPGPPWSPRAARRAAAGRRRRRRERRRERGHVGHATVRKSYAAGCTEVFHAPLRPLRHVMLLRSPCCTHSPATAGRAHSDHGARNTARTTSVSRCRPAPGHRRRGRDCRHALPSPHVAGPSAPPHPAPRGARARCPRRAVSARLQGVCKRPA